MPPPVGLNLYGQTPTPEVWLEICALAKRGRVALANVNAATEKRLRDRFAEKVRKREDGVWEIG